MQCERKIIMLISHGAISFNPCIFRWDIQNMMMPFIDNSLKNWPLEWLELVMAKEWMPKASWYRFKEMQYVFLQGMTFLEFETRSNNFNSATLTLICYMHWTVAFLSPKLWVAQNISNGVKISCKLEAIGFCNKSFRNRINWQLSYRNVIQ